MTIDAANRPCAVPGLDGWRCRLQADADCGDPGRTGHSSADVSYRNELAAFDW
ncbi:MAG: hypothetical protein KDK24_14975 [Pseudooceanicola sp.]|nr:hypothetical protein [Pseudooceanicola sp.]